MGDPYLGEAVDEPFTLDPPVRIARLARHAADLRFAGRPPPAAPDSQPTDHYPDRLTNEPSNADLGSVVHLPHR